MRQELKNEDQRYELAEEMANKYLAGEPIRDLAACYGVSYGTARRLLIEASITLRGRGGDNRRRK